MDRYYAIRDRWLSSARFQHWAAAFPLTRPTARRRARALFDLCAGFVYSQILYACVRLKLFEFLAGAPKTAAQISEALRLPMDSTERLLEAAVSLRLVERRASGRFGLGALGAAMLGNPAVSAMVEHHRLLYADLHDPVRLLRGEHRQTELGKYWAYTATDKPASLPEADTAGYTALMGDSVPLVAEEVLDAYPLGKHRCLMDVGGGDGSFLVAATSRYPQLKVVLFDLPPVAERAAVRFTELGLQQQASTVGGDFLKQPLPQCADVISLVRVVHDHTDEAAAALIRAVFNALPTKGVLLLAEPMLRTPGAAPVAEAYFGFYLLAMGRGRPRAPEELQHMVLQAGFASASLAATRQPLQTRLIVARKEAETSVKNN